MQNGSAHALALSLLVLAASAPARAAEPSGPAHPVSAPTWPRRAAEPAMT
jgi:hypothetical protein